MIPRQGRPRPPVDPGAPAVRPWQRGAPRDPRCEDAIELLRSHRDADGDWPLQNKYSGKVFFEMETLGRKSRWNTLRALRVLRWWSGEATDQGAD